MSDAPLVQVNTKLWALLNARSEFAAMFPVGNQVRYDHLGPDLDLDQANPADFPRVRLALTSTHPRLNENSSADGDTWVWDLQICMGEQRQVNLWAIYWMVFRACADWKTQLRTATSWKGKQFIGNFDIALTHNRDPKYFHRYTDLGESRGTSQWISVLEFHITVDFANADLIAAGT